LKTTLLENAFPSLEIYSAYERHFIYTLLYYIRELDALTSHIPDSFTISPTFGPLALSIDRNGKNTIVTYNLDSTHPANSFYLEYHKSHLTSPQTSSENTPTQAYFLCKEDNVATGHNTEIVQCLDSIVCNDVDPNSLSTPYDETDQNHSETKLRIDIERVSNCCEQREITGSVDPRFEGSELEDLYDKTPPSDNVTVKDDTSASQ